MVSSFNAAEKFVGIEIRYPNINLIKEKRVEDIFFPIN